MPQNIPPWPNCLQPQTFSEPRSGLVRDFRYLQNNANLTPIWNQKSIITCLATQWPVALTDCLNHLKQIMISYMEVIALQSGSSGNCIYVEADGMQLLFDAGISCIQAESRLADHGRNIRDIDALIISHDHRDHAVGMGIYQRKYGLPIYVTRATLAVAQQKIRLGKMNDIRHFDAGSTFSVGDVQIQTIPTPHDAADGVVFVVDDGIHKVGILTDLGHAFDELDEILPQLDAVFIESNHDLEMLAGSFYPESLKARIRSSQGHISNLDAAELLQRAASPKLQWACLAHLSEESNTPELAMETHRRLLGDRFPVYCASRDSATPPLRL